MRPENIEEKKAQRKRSAVSGVLLFGLIQLATAVFFVALCLIPGVPGWYVALFGALAAICLLTLIPAVLVLKERFKEIEGGELDEAGKY